MPQYPVAGAPGLSVGDRIESHRGRMSESMNRIADQILENPRLPLDLSITELAERVGTSAATVTRFCQLIGFAGYVQFRVDLATDLGREPLNADWQIDMGRTFHPAAQPGDVLAALLNTHTRSLQSTAAMLDVGAARAVALRIKAAQHLDIYGVGGSSALAFDLQSRLYRLGVPCHAWGDVHTGLTSASVQTENVVAIGISLSGETADTVAMLAQARRSGAFTVAVTSAIGSAISRIADVCLVSAAPSAYQGPDYLSSKYGQLLILDLLYLLVAQLDFEATATRLETTRIAVRGGIWPPGRGGSEERKVANGYGRRRSR